MCSINEYYYPLFVIWLALRAYQKYSAILRATLLCDTTRQNTWWNKYIGAQVKAFLCLREELKRWEKRAREGSARGLAFIIPSTRPLADFSPMTTCSWATQRWFISLLKHEQGFKGFNTFLMNHTHIFFKRNLMLTKTIQDFLQGEGIELFFITKCEWGLFFLSLITHFHRDLYSKLLWATEAKSEYLF